MDYRIMHTGQSIRGTHNFDIIADGEYDESIPEHVMRHLTRRRVNVLRQAVSTGLVLDVGCGTGRLLSAIPADRYQRYGLDLSSGMVRAANMRDQALRCGVASATALPYADEAFDVVFCAAVLHHIAEPKAVAQAIEEMVRVTRRGGVTIIWDHNPLNPYWPIIMRRVPQDIGEERLISRHEINETLDGLQGRFDLQVHWRQMTFIPDFAPVWSLPFLIIFEQIIEQMPLIRYISAHNVAIIRRMS